MAKKSTLPFIGQKDWGSMLNAYLMQMQSGINTLSQKYSNLTNNIDTGIYTGTGIMNGYKTNYRIDSNEDVDSEIEPKYGAGIYDLDGSSSFFLSLQTQIFINGTDVIIVNNGVGDQTGLDDNYASQTVSLGREVDFSEGFVNNTVKGLFISLNGPTASYSILDSNEYADAITNIFLCQIGLFFKDGNGKTYFRFQFSDSSKTSFVDWYQITHAFAGNVLEFSDNFKINNTSLVYTNSNINMSNGAVFGTHTDTVNFDYTSDNLIYRFYKMTDTSISLATNAFGNIISTDAEIAALLEGHCFAAYFTTFGEIHIVVNTDVSYRNYLGNAVQRLNFLTPVYAMISGYTEIYRGVQDSLNGTYYLYSSQNNRISANDTLNTITGGEFLSSNFSIIEKDESPVTVGEATNKLKLAYDRTDGIVDPKTLYFKNIVDGSHVLTNQINNENISINGGSININDGNIDFESTCVDFSTTSYVNFNQDSKISSVEDGYEQGAVLTGDWFCKDTPVSDLGIVNKYYVDSLITFEKILLNLSVFELTDGVENLQGFNPDDYAFIAHLSQNKHVTCNEIKIRLSVANAPAAISLTRDQTIGLVGSGTCLDGSHLSIKIYDTSNIFIVLAKILNGHIRVLSIQDPLHHNTIDSLSGDTTITNIYPYAVEVTMDDYLDV